MNSAHLSWKTLRLLAWHEGNLMVSRATMRLKGFLCDDAECALDMAALVVTDDDVEGVRLSVYSAEVLAEIHLIARDISESAWLSALQWSRQHHAQIRENDRQAAERAELQALHVSEVEFDGQRYISWPWRGDSMASIVYEPAVMPAAGHYRITEMQSDRIIATVAGLQDAREIARYAASHDGGYGDVCIVRCEAELTHNDFESWLF
ncbi:hypothetical protein LA637_p2088 (plasmid) [Erwinia amylovora LA637]|uniref:hypothetical protein n=1 Tax=Erwinia amylovora TaxID=552 RepID=UPI0003D5A5C5|nr:hypothetical protein [Erwinia amylovora]CDK23960.1 hypothetical protein LA637_p2088 [Erwinia amylovora LA637]